MATGHALSPIHVPDYYLAGIKTLVINRYSLANVTKVSGLLAQLPALKTLTIGCAAILKAQQVKSKTYVMPDGYASMLVDYLGDASELMDYRGNGILSGVADDALKSYSRKLKTLDNARGERCFDITAYLWVYINDGDQNYLVRYKHVFLCL